MKPRAAISVAGRSVLIQSLRGGRAASVYVQGRPVAEAVAMDEARVIALEHRARIALDLLSVPGAADLVAMALDEGTPLRADRVVYRALALAETPPG